MVKGIEAQAGALAQGIHDLPAVDYHADPCELPSLSSGGIKRLLSGSPAEFSAHHPRLTRWPDLCQREGTKAQDRGTIIHSLVLGKGAGFHACDPQDVEARTEKGTPYKSWTGKAKVWKETQEEAGIIVLSRKEGAAVQSAAESLVRLLSREYGEWPIGRSEETLIWQRETEHGPIWCRGLLDCLALDHLVILDPKSTALGLSDRSLQRIASNDGWHIQAAWYLNGLEHVVGSGRPITFRFPVVEIDPPYQARFVDLPESWLHIAGQRIDRACELFAKCLYENSWPAYSEVCRPQPPNWMLNEFEEEELG